MIGKKKIAVNVLATYGRSVYGLFLGIFTARWALGALGKVDYGLAGLVGGMALFVTFLNELFSFAVVRFYGFSVGKGLGCDDASAIQESQKWFNAAFTIHTIFPLILLMIGYPIGSWAIREFLTIPADRIGDCLWVWRFTCCACFVGMSSVPFTAMYIAKQDIAELTIYDVSSVTCKALFLYYIVTHPGVWLIEYALCLCLVSVIPNLLKVVRGCIKYDECRIRRDCLFDYSRMTQIGKFGAARFWTMFASLIAGQGDSILVNKFLGPIYNATLSIGNTVVSQTATLSNSLNGAFWPAITNLAGAGQDNKVKDFSYRVCLYGAILMLIFVIPLCLEMDYVITLWLKSPPPYVTRLCIVALVASITERMTEGLYMPIMAFNRGVGTYSLWVGWCGFSNFAISFVMLALGYGITAICLAILLGKVILLVMRLYLSRKLAGMSILYWARKVFVPVALISCVAACAGSCSRIFEASFLRVLLTIVLCESVFLVSVWLFIFTNEEKTFLLNKMCSVLKLRRGRVT